ncbi:MAG: hypothetical protein JW810_06620 [Sedimentisphaerales bacterium]|nr:hypothetical protein [Sedimentisphaerales bacterium]
MKLGRRGDFLGIPLGWLGRRLIRHEMRLLGRLRELVGIPQVLGGWGEWGMVYGYIPGCSLDEKPELPDTFFDRLAELVRRIHERRIAYVDMNKRGNILLGPDQLPGIIDFQIACHIPERLAGSRRLADWLLSVLQEEDRYHLLKHKRRFRGDLLSERERQLARRISGWIAMHRALTRPLRDARRRILAGLFRQGRLVIDQTMPLNPETDPGRWDRKAPPSG